MITVRRSCLTSRYNEYEENRTYTIFLLMLLPKDREYVAGGYQILAMVTMVFLVGG